MKIIKENAKLVVNVRNSNDFNNKYMMRLGEEALFNYHRNGTQMTDFIADKYLYCMLTYDDTNILHHAHGVSENVFIEDEAINDWCIEPKYIIGYIKALMCFITGDIFDFNGEYEIRKDVVQTIHNFKLSSEKLVGDQLPKQFDYAFELFANHAVISDEVLEWLANSHFKSSLNNL